MPPARRAKHPFFRPLDQSRLDWIQVNIPDFRKIVFAVSNRPIMKSDLPDFHPILMLFLKLVRESALNELDGFFERSVLSRGDEKMEVVRHHDKFVQKVRPSFAATQNSLDK